MESKIEKKQFPYVVQAQYEHHTAAEYPFTIPLCIRTRVMLPLMWLKCCCHKLKKPICHKGGNNPFIKHTELIHFQYLHAIWNLTWAFVQDLTPVLAYMALKWQPVVNRKVANHTLKLKKKNICNLENFDITI